MLYRFFMLLVASFVGLSAGACDDTWTLDEPSTASSALIKLNALEPAAEVVVDVELRPTAELVGLHGMIEHRVLVYILANYETVPGPCPPPAEVLVDISSMHMVENHTMQLMLFEAGPTMYEFEAVVDADCGDLRFCLSDLVFAAELLDLTSGNVTLEVGLID